MRRPSRGTRSREDRRKGLPGNGERIKQDRREELDIGLQRTVRVLPPQRLADIGFDLAREGKVGAVGRKALDRCFQHIRAGIAYPIYSVTKTHQTLAASK